MKHKYKIFITVLLFVVGCGFTAIFVFTVKGLHQSCPPEVSAELATVKTYLPILEQEALPPSLRFVPHTHAEYLTSVYTIWNLLDRIGAVFETQNFQYGYMRNVQLHRYSELFWGKEHPQIYCEIGLNAGHGTFAVLLANPFVQVYSFDLMKFKYSSLVIQLLKAMFPDRFHIFPGDSRETVRKYAAGVKKGRFPYCDIILVDGDHTHQGAYSDILNMGEVAACGNILIVDDVNDGPGLAIKQATAEGVLKIVEWNFWENNTVENPCLRQPLKRVARHGPLRCAGWGFALSLYTRCQPK